MAVKVYEKEIRKQRRRGEGRQKDGLGRLMSVSLFGRVIQNGKKTPSQEGWESHAKSLISISEKSRMPGYQEKLLLK